MKMERNDKGKFLLSMYYLKQAERIKISGFIRSYIITNYTEFNLDKLSDSKLLSVLKAIHNYKDTTPEEKLFIKELINKLNESKREEREYKKEIERYLMSEPTWFWLSFQRGISSIISMNIVTRLDINKANSVNSFYKYCGLHVQDGKAVKKEENKKSDHNPKMKVLMRNIGKALIMHKHPKYYDIYVKKKEQYSNVEYPLGHLHSLYPSTYSESDTKLTKSHANNRAFRYMIKRFIKDYWEVCVSMKNKADKLEAVEVSTN